MFKNRMIFKKQNDFFHCFSIIHIRIGKDILIGFPIKLIYFNNHTSKPPRNKEFPIHNLKNLIWLIFASKTFTFASNILPMENKKYSNLKILFQI